MVFYIEVANRVVKINCLYKNVGILSMDYLIDVTDPDIEITSTEEDIDFEKRRVVKDRLLGSDNTQQAPQYLETLSVYRKIAYSMLNFNTILMHGTVIGLESNAFMISGISGIGKTTIAREILERIPGSFIINGDKPLIEIKNDLNESVAYGTPWCGKEHISRNCGMKLKYIFFLTRGEKNEIKEMNKSEAFPFIMQQTYRHNDKRAIIKTVNLIAAMSKYVKFYRLSVMYADDVDFINVDSLVGFLNQN